MPRKKNQLIFDCASCGGKDHKKESTQPITNRLRREYYECKCCGNRNRVLIEDGVVTDVERVLPEQTIINLTKLLLRKLNQREIHEIHGYLSKLDTSYL